MRAALCVAFLLLLCPAAYAEHGPYLDYGREPVGYYRIGPEGVPQYVFGGRVVDHPDGVAQWGLRNWSHGQRKPLMVASHWFVRHQRRDGGFGYPFDWNADGVMMHSPWISSMAQGQAASVLVRAYYLTHRRRYLRAALRSMLPFIHRVSQGGVVTIWGGYRWYEEYPGPHAQHVLNGFEFALIGLHDMVPYSRRARLLWRRGVRALVAHIAEFDLPSARTQIYAAIDGGRIPVNAAYRHAHAVLTAELARLTGNRVLRRWARRWAAYDTG
jgi:heparosan-N-sulfate-glucuronate 5-epimerase